MTKHRGVSSEANDALAQTVAMHSVDQVIQKLFTQAEHRFPRSC